MFIFQVLYHKLHFLIFFANSIAFALSNVFSYYLNRIFVFKIHRGKLFDLLVEFSSFISSRALTYFLDIIFMFIFATVFKMDTASETLTLKIIDQIGLGIFNYFLSQAVFKNSEKRIKARTTNKNYLDDQ